MVLFTGISQSVVKRLKQVIDLYMKWGMGGEGGGGDQWLL